MCAYSLEPNGMNNFKKCGIFLIAAMLFGTSCSISQNLRVRRMDKSVRLPRTSLSAMKVKDILSVDRAGLIDPQFYSFGDSLETFFFQGDHWFRLKFAARKWDDKSAVELFAYSDSSKQLWQITHHDLFWSDAYSGTIEDLYIHSGKLFAISACHENDLVGHVKLLVVNTRRHEVSLEICLKNAAWLEDMRSIGDSLHVILVPMKREKDPDYASTWWMPRGRPSKWNYIRDGFSWHFVLDRDFKVLSGEKMDREATDYDKLWRMLLDRSGR